MSSTKKNTIRQQGIQRLGLVGGTLAGLWAAVCGVARTEAQVFRLDALRPENVVRVSLTPPPGDYGDAPDGTSARYAAPFQGVLGRFPTEFATSNSRYHLAGGHTITANQEYLGTLFSMEAGPRDHADPDQIENFVDDDFDDGWVSGPCAGGGIGAPWAPFVPVTMSYRVTVAPGAPAGQRFVNVLYDTNHDGRWANGAGGQEWLAVDVPVNVAPGTSAIVSVGPFPFPVSPIGAWMRVSLTRSRVVGSFADDGTGWDGSGTFSYGEIEDHLIANALAFASAAASDADSASASAGAAAGIDISVHASAWAWAYAQASAHANALAVSYASAQADAAAAAQAHADAIAAAGAIASACISCPCGTLCAQAGAFAAAAVEATARAEASASASAQALAVAYADAQARVASFAAASAEVDAYVSAFAGAVANASASASASASAYAAAVAAACAGDAQAAAAAAATARANADASAAAYAAADGYYRWTARWAWVAASWESASASAVAIAAYQTESSSAAKASAQAAALSLSMAFAGVSGACTTCYTTCPPCPTTTPSDRYRDGAARTTSARTTAGVGTWVMTGTVVSAGTSTITGVKWQSVDSGTFTGSADISIWDGNLVQGGLATDTNAMMQLPNLPVARQPVLSDCGQPVQLFGQPVYEYTATFPPMTLPWGSTVYVGARAIGNSGFTSQVLSAHRDHDSPIVPSYLISSPSGVAQPVTPCDRDYVMYLVTSGTQQ